MMVDEGIGYLCKNERLAILRCADSSDKAVCTYVYLGEPLRETGSVSTTDLRSSLTARTRACTTQRVTVDRNGNVILVEEAGTRRCEILRRAPLRIWRRIARRIRTSQVRVELMVPKCHPPLE